MQVMFPPAVPDSAEATLKSALVLLICVAFWSLIAPAQSSTGEMSSTVLDGSGATVGSSTYGVMATSTDNRDLQFALGVEF